MKYEVLWHISHELHSHPINMVTDDHTGTLETLWDWKGLSILFKKGRIIWAQAPLSLDVTLFRHLANVNPGMISMVTWWAPDSLMNEKTRQEQLGEFVGYFCVRSRGVILSLMQQHKIEYSFWTVWYYITINNHEFQKVDLKLVRFCFFPWA